MLTCVAHGRSLQHPGLDAGSELFVNYAAEKNGSAAPHQCS
jgi:hypothetical protein